MDRIIKLLSRYYMIFLKGLGGTLWMVTKRRDWYCNKLSAIFGGVRIHEVDGYFVFEAQRRGLHYARARR